MDYIKKHKLTAFILLVFIVVVGFGYFVYNMFIGSSGMPVYGNRLDGKDEVPITEDQYTKIVDEISNESIVLEVDKPTLRGKILSVIITIGDSTATAKAKELATKVSNVLTEEQNNFYDIEIFITKYYHCSLEVTGLMDEEGNFTNDVTVKFSDDLSLNKHVTNYGLSDQKTVDYNNKQEYTITEDGTYVIYGYTKDKVGERTCNIKVVRKASDAATTEETIDSVLSESFPIIGYKRKATNNFVWTKDR